MKGVPDISAKELEALTESETSLTGLFGHVDGALVSAFQTARNEKAHRKAQEEAQAEKRREIELKDREQENKQNADIHIFIQVLDQIQQRIAYLEERMAERYETLKAKYGEDVIGGMAATYLTEEELAGLETDDERCHAMAARFLDKNGEIKPEYQHLEDAKYIRDWAEVQRLEGLSTKLKSGRSLQPDEKVEILHTIRNSPLGGSETAALLSQDDDLRANVEQQHSSAESIKGNAHLKFS